MHVRHPMDVLHSFSIKKNFYNTMDLRLFYFHVMISMLGMVSGKKPDICYFCMVI